MATLNSPPPPNGVYVPAVLFMDQNEDLDIPAITSHVLRLAKVGSESSAARSLIMRSEIRAVSRAFSFKAATGRLSICLTKSAS